MKERGVRKTWEMFVYNNDLIAPRVSLIDLEPNVRSLPNSRGGHKFDSLDPIGVRLNNYGRQLTSFTIHESTQSVPQDFFHRKKIAVI